MIKLHEIPKNSKIYLNNGTHCIFEYIDGLCSFCTTKKFNEVIYLSVNTLLEEYEDGYRIIIPHDTELRSVV